MEDIEVGSACKYSLVKHEILPVSEVADLNKLDHTCYFLHFQHKKFEIILDRNIYEN